MYLYDTMLLMRRYSITDSLINLLRQISFFVKNFNHFPMAGYLDFYSICEISPVQHLFKFDNLNRDCVLQFTLIPLQAFKSENLAEYALICKLQTPNRSID